MPDGDRDLYVLNVNTAEIRPLLEGRASDRLMGWLPDGSGLLFLSDRGATSGIWMLPLGSGLEPGEPRMLRSDVWNAVPLGMSRDAAFYGVEVEQPHVYTGAIDTKNGGYLAPPGPVQAANDGRSYNGEFSPDGLYLAYAVYRGGDDRDNYEIVVRAVGGDDVRVFKHNLQIGPIGWTPDSRGVLVYSEPDGDKVRVELLDLETGEFTVANPSPDANSAGMQLQVSPDGRHMYATVPTGGWGADLRNHLEDLSKLGLYELGVYDDSRRLIAPAAFPGTPFLSPDGKTLAVLEVDRENLNYARIYTIPLAGGEPTTVFEIEDDITVLGRAIGGGSGAQWTADGTHLLFTLDGAVMKVSVEGGPVEKLVDLPKGRLGHFRLHPDGSRFVIDGGLNKGEIWIVKGLPGMPAGAATTDR
jgi:Tol biopolymer transport system component